MRRRGGFLTVGLVALAVLPGCRVKDSAGSATNGKDLFVKRCGSCHALNRAGTKGVTGPNLDDAFRQDRRDGIPTDAIRGLVHRQILYPNRAGQMPGKLVTGEDAYDVATYVAQSVAKPGQDTGALAQIGQAASKKDVSEKNGSVDIPTDPNGQLAFLVGKVKATPGKLTIDTVNKAAIGHNIAVKGNGIDVKGAVVQGGKTSTVSVDLKPGTYTFYCSVPGHEQGGMEGTITVK